MPIWLLALLFIAQDNPPQTCALSGRVVSSVTGAPLSKVELHAERVDRETPSASTTTDAKGNFTMVDLPAGLYRLKGHRNGYLDRYYGARIALEAGQELLAACDFGRTFVQPC